jgi:hypothetical protein
MREHTAAAWQAVGSACCWLWQVGHLGKRQGTGMALICTVGDIEAV